ncbi:MAG: glycosyltransferase family 2 protein [Elusimicrobiaceae bacterium]|nr:glycosyltransferase family 2 protein [Elusimicrobiaceae bacterium]
MPPITLAMIARNEAHDLPGCVESARGLAEEIVLVDSGSSDETIAIARSLGATVSEHEFDGYAAQKNRALGRASNSWILHLDPDERLSPALRAEIENLFSAGGPECDAYSIPYENHFLGRRLKYGGLGSEKHIRLFRRDKASFSGGLVHEGIEVAGATGELENRIIHNSYPTLEEYFEKFNRYTTFAAVKMHRSGKRFSVFKAAAVPYEFAKRYILRLGFLDGFAGLVWSAVSAFYVFVKYAKLWQLQREADK